MDKKKYKILLADDDEDDCDFFKDALDALLITTDLNIVNDGVELMHFLSQKDTDSLPDILFLDLNMPRKNGAECLNEIKLIQKLKKLPVIIFSTSLDTSVVDLMYKSGATYYIRKPGDFSKLKRVLLNALDYSNKNNFKQPLRDEFILQP